MSGIDAEIDTYGRIFQSHRGISWPMPNKIDDTLFIWQEALVQEKNIDGGFTKISTLLKKEWRIIPACIFVG